MAESDIARYNSPTKEIEKSATRADSIMHGQGVRPVGEMMLMVRGQWGLPTNMMLLIAGSTCYAYSYNTRTSNSEIKVSKVAVGNKAIGTG